MAFKVVGAFILMLMNFFHNFWSGSIESNSVKVLFMQMHLFFYPQFCIIAQHEFKLQLDIKCTPSTAFLIHAENNMTFVRICFHFLTEPLKELFKRFVDFNHNPNGRFGHIY